MNEAVVAVDNAEIGFETTVVEFRDGLDATAPQTKLEIQGFSLSLGGRLVLADVGFALYPGEIVGILGPNGCGKTSLMRCLIGLIKPARGTLWLDGTPEVVGSKRVAAAMGVVFQTPSLDLLLSCKENLVLGAQLFGLSSKESKGRINELLEFMELKERRKERAGTLSGGMQRRLELARALIHSPEILLLDEPTGGLDLQSFERTWHRLELLRNQKNMSILVTTHRPDEAERCDRLIVMDRGHVIACDTPKALLARVAGEVLTIEAAEAYELQDKIEEICGESARCTEGGLELDVWEAHKLVPRLIEALPVGRVRSVSVRRPTMADAFFNLTGHPLGLHVER